MKLDTPNNPKFTRLMRRLGTGKAETAGLLELLWHFTASQAPAGDVGKWTDADIATAAGWNEDPEEFISGLVESRWLDSCGEHRLIVHDWHEHAPEMIRKRNVRRRLDFVRPTADNGRQRQTTAAHQTSPDLTRPDPTSPVHETDSRPPHATEPQGAECRAGTNAVWLAVNEARAMYLPNATGLGLDDPRRRRMATIRKAYGETSPVDALHGLMASSLQRDDDWDPLPYLVPETCWQTSKIQKYLDADRAARASGLKRPYTRDQTVTQDRSAARADEQIARLAGRGQPRGQA